MSKFWFKFEYAKWRTDPQLRTCSKETRGFWIDCIAAMEERETFYLQGKVDDLCRELFCTKGEFERSLAELKSTGAASISRNRSGIVKLVSRKILKEVNRTEYNKLKQREYRRQTRVKQMSNNSSKDKSFKVLDSSPNGEEQTKRNARTHATDKKIILPADYHPPLETWQRIKIECPDLNPEDELEEFITFWRDIATKYNKRTMRGWNQSWLNRMKTQQERKQGAKGNAATNIDRLRATKAIIDRYPSEAEIALERETAGNAQRSE